CASIAKVMILFKSCDHAKLQATFNPEPAMQFRATLLAVVLPLLSLACGSTKVSNEQHGELAPGAPSMVYVANFDLGAAKVQQDPGTLTGRPRLFKLKKDAGEELQKLGDELEQDIVEDLRKQNFRAERLADDAPRPASGWIVNGNFLELG